METNKKNSQCVKQKPQFWRYFFNVKVEISAVLIWLGLICQDFYAVVFHWITGPTLSAKYLYSIRWIVILIILYFALLLINYLVNLPALKSLYHKKIAYIVLGIWLAINLTCFQLLYFEYKIKLYLYFIKFLHLLALYGLVLTITRLIQRYREPKIKHQLILTGIFCLIGFIFLLLTYPGAWNSDDIWVLNNVAHYDLVPWQHMLIGLFDVFCLQTLPFVFSVILIQILLNALMFSYCVVTLANLFTKTPRQALILEIILSFAFFLPPVFFYTLSGWRMGIYQFLNLYFLTKLIALFYHKEEKISCLKLCEIVFLTVIVSTLRAEGIFYPIIVLVTLLLLGQERLKRTLAFITAGIALVGAFGVNTLNHQLVRHNNYTIIATIKPIRAIIWEADDIDDESLAVINKVLDVELIQSGYFSYGLAAYIRSNYTKADYRNYLVAVVKIILQHPGIATKTMWDDFVTTVRFHPKYGYTSWALSEMAINSFVDPESLWYWFNQPHITSSHFYKPINLALRNRVLAWLGGITVDHPTSASYTYEVKMGYHLFYNLLFPGILFAIALIIALLCRRWFLLLPFAAILCHLAIVIITSPHGLFFYYLPTYFNMYVFGIVTIWYGISTLIDKIHKKQVTA